MIRFLKKISSIVFIVGLFSALFNTYEKIQYERVKKQGIETNATALRAVGRKYKYTTGTSGDLHVEFFDRNQVKHQAETHIGDINEEILGLLRLNPVIKIKYLEESPSNILAPSYSKDPMENILEATGMFFIGTVGMFLVIKYEQKKINSK